MSAELEDRSVRCSVIRRGFDGRRRRVSDRGLARGSRMRAARRRRACRPGTSRVTTAPAPVRAPGADVARRDDHRVDADERAVADRRAVLARAVVVGGDGAGADVHALADLGVAEVAHVVLLGAAPRGGCS